MTLKACVYGLATLLLLASSAVHAQVPRDRTTPPAAPATTGTATIVGRMTSPSPAGAVPVRRARVTLESNVLRQPMTVDTDTDGRYRFSALPAGMFRVTGEKAGFVQMRTDPRRAFEPSPEFELKAGQALTMDLPMVAGAALEGRILKANGDPATNIVVSAVRMVYDVNGRRPTAVKQSRTDDLGRFRVHTLPAGEYQIDAAPDPLDAARQMPTPGTRPPTLSRTYYPGSARLEESRAVAVTVGQTVTNLDFTMTSVSVSRVRGKVVSSTGAPANGAAVRMQRVGGPVGEVRGSSSIESNDFEYAAVPAGEYWMMASARPAPGAEPEFSATRLVVDGADLTNIVLTTAKQPPVAGRVEGAAIAPMLEIVANETAFEWPPLNGEAPRTNRWSAAVAPDGAFTFNALPGPRLIRVNGLPAGVALKNVFLGDVDVTDTPFEIKASDVPPAMRVVLTSETGAVSGVVKSADGGAATGARVVLFSEDDKLWGTRSRVIHTLETRPDGSYQFRGVLPGRYHVIAVSFLESLAWTDAAVLHQLKSSAESVNVPVGNLTVNLVVKR